MLRCDWCGYVGEGVFVHGHTQCARCRTNIDPCCSGQSAIECAEVENVVVGRRVCGVVGGAVGRSGLEPQQDE